MQRITRSELLDSDMIPPPELAANLADIARINRWSGATAALCHVVFSLIGSRSAFTLIDVGTGAADFPLTLGERAAQRGVTLTLIAADRHWGVVRCVHQTDPALSLVQLDGVCLPFPAQSIDVVTAAQVIHHLPPDQVSCLLLELARVSRVGFVLLDLERSAAAVPAIWLLTRLMSHNRLTRYDGPLSARRAYRGSEIAGIGAQVNVSLVISPLFPFRWIATWIRPTP